MLPGPSPVPAGQPQHCQQCYGEPPQEHEVTFPVQGWRRAHLLLTWLLCLAKALERVTLISKKKKVVKKKKKKDEIIRCQLPFVIPQPAVNSPCASPCRDTGTSIPLALLKAFELHGHSWRSWAPSPASPMGPQHMVGRLQGGTGQSVPCYHL